MGLFASMGDPNTMGLLSAAQGLLQASGPSRTPVSFGQVLGGGLQGLQAGRDEYLKNQLMQQQMKAASLKALQPGETLYDINTNKPVMSSDPFVNMNGQGGASGDAAGQSVSGDDYLKTLPSSIAPTVKGLAEGKIPFPGGYALKTPYWQQMMSAVTKYDPSFDAVNYNARTKTRNSFTSGTDANNITALNTAMAHAGALNEAYDKLNSGTTGNTDYPTWNAIKNFALNEGGNKDIQTNTAAVATKGHALSEELAKVFRSTGMAESDIRAWEQKLNTNATPSQSKEVLNSAMDLINGRLSALSEKYNQGMGTTKQPLELLSPDAQKIYGRLRGGGGTGSNNGQYNMQTPSGVSYRIVQ